MSSKIVKVLKIGAVGALLLGATAGCMHTDATVKQNYDQGVIDGKASIDIKAEFDKGAASVVIPTVDITSDNKQAIEDAIKAKIDVGELQMPVPEFVGFSEDSLEFGSDVAFVIKHNDLNRLWKGDISYDGDDYTTEEILTIKPNIVYEDEQEGVSAVELEDGDMAYTYHFIDMPTIQEDKSLDINFNGKDISITKWDVDKVTVKTGVDMTMNVGNFYTTEEGKLVTIKAIGENAIQVIVDGKTEVISVGDTEEVNNVEIFVEEIFYDDVKADRSVYLTFGKDITSTIEDGQPAELFGYDEDNDKLLYSVTEDGIGLVFNDNYNYYKTDEDHLSVLYEGQKLATMIGNVGYALDEAYDYFTVKFYENNIDETEGIMINAEMEYNGDNYGKAFCNIADGTISLKVDGDWIPVTGVTLRDTDIAVTTKKIGDDWFCKVGDVSTDLETVKLGDADISVKDHTVLAKGGTKVLDVKDNLENKEVVAKIAEETVKGTVTIE